ncbi:NAD(P)H-binding protein, partial [Acinetobacter baumannii]
TGADAVLHVAGVVNAPTREGFAAGNIDGTRAMLAAAQAAGIPRFVLVSSLAARAPSLSIYGWSKAEAEKLVIDCPLDWTIIRPPAVYGPGD